MFINESQLQFQPDAHFYSGGKRHVAIARDDDDDDDDDDDPAVPARVPRA